MQGKDGRQHRSRGWCIRVSYGPANCDPFMNPSVESVGLGLRYTQRLLGESAALGA
jgi:hypothetical protein